MRKTKEIVITAEGRDEGKKFLLEEMSAAAAEKWAFRALGAMARSGIDIPEHIAEAGMPGVLSMGLKAIFSIEFREAEPLLDELMACIKRVETAAVREIVDNDIEEVQTRLQLRSAVFELHTSFSVAAFLSETWGAAMKRVAALRSTQISQEASLS